MDGKNGVCIGVLVCNKKDKKIHSKISLHKKTRRGSFLSALDEIRNAIASTHAARATHDGRSALFRERHPRGRLEGAPRGC